MTNVSKWIISGLQSGFLVTTGATEKPEPKPNIVLIMADDLGYGDLGCYGNTVVTTPNLDQLAAEGMRFTDYHSNSAVCAPTRAAMMTGRYQQRAGVYSVYQGKLKRSEITIAQRLKEAGYATGIFGKWHLSGHATSLDQVMNDYPSSVPTTWGFDEYVGIMSGMIDAISHYTERGFPDWWHGNQLTEEEGYSTHLLTKYATQFIRKNQNTPFFVYVPLTDIHFPWTTPEDEPYYEEGVDNPTSAYPDRKRGGRYHGTDQLKPVVQRMIYELDKSVGAIVDTLKELELQNHTLVVFVSDNGGYENYQDLNAGDISDMGPYKGGKHQDYEGGHRVPAIVWQPGTVPSGIVSDATVMSFDWFPTFLELVGLPDPDPNGANALDGRSILSHLYQQAPVQKRTLFWNDLNKWAVRDGDWKMVVPSPTADAQLYNLAQDPGEATNLAQSFPERVDNMIQALGEWENGVGSFKPIPITHPDNSGTEMDTEEFIFGAKIFTDRSYTIAEVPEMLEGLRFVRSSIDGGDIECLQDGEIYAVTAVEGTKDTSQADMLREYGFTKTAQPPFCLFQTEAAPKEIFKKTVLKGESFHGEKLTVWVLGSGLDVQ